MALINEKTNLDFKPPPEKMKWWLVRLAAARAICVAAFTETADECVVRARIPYPRGSFNPRIRPGSIQNSPEVDEINRNADFKVNYANGQIEVLRAYHPGYPEGL